MAGGRDIAFRFFALCIFNAGRYYRFLHSWYYLPRSLSEGVTFLHDVQNFPPLPHREFGIQTVRALCGAFFHRPVRLLSAHLHSVPHFQARPHYGPGRFFSTIFSGRSISLHPVIGYCPTLVNPWLVIWGHPHLFSAATMIPCPPPTDALFSSGCGMGAPCSTQDGGGGVELVPGQADRLLASLRGRDAGVT